MYQRTWKELQPKSADMFRVLGVEFRKDWVGASVFFLLLAVFTWLALALLQ